MTANRQFGRMITVMVVAATLLVACGGPSRLESLQTDPMAKPTLGFGELTRSSGSEGDESGFLLSSPAKVSTWFLVANDRELEAVDELANQAREAGWELEEVESSGNLRGVKWVDGLRSSILIQGLGQNGPDGFDPEFATVWVDIFTSDSHS